MRKRDTDRPAIHGIKSAIRVFIILALLPGLVAWELPFTSQRVRGDNDFDAGNYEDAIAHYNRALEDSVSDWELLYNLGTSYYHSGDWGNAVENLSYAVQIAEDSGVPKLQVARIYHNLGLAYLQLGQCDNAVPALSKAAELNPDDADIAKNYDFARNYCDDEAENADNTEGEEEEQGEGDQQDDQQGQADQGESNDENEAQDQSSESENGNNPAGGGENENQDESTNDGDNQQDQTDQAGDEGENQQDQNGQEEQEENAHEGEGEQEDNKPDQSGQDNENNGGGQGENQDQSGSGNVEEQSGQGLASIPDDGLNLSDQQVQELLDYMSNLERSRAPKYFQNSPGEGTYLDNETMADLLRRLFLGLPTNESSKEPEDGIDW